MLNVIAVTGRLTKEPELRKTNSGESFANFSLAIDSPTKNADGERNTCFLDCIAFKSTAENLVSALHKGSKVAVHGAINQRDFIRKDGSKGRAYEIICSGVEFLDAKPQDPQEPDVEDLPDDDIPFKEEETKPQEKSQPVKKDPQPKYDPFTGKPLKPKAKK